MDLEVGWGGDMDWIELAVNRNKWWWAFVNAVMDLWLGFS